MMPVAILVPTSFLIYAILYLLKKLSLRVVKESLSIRNTSDLSGKRKLKKNEI